MFLPPLAHTLPVRMLGGPVGLEHLDAPGRQRDRALPGLALRRADRQPHTTHPGHLAGHAQRGRGLVEVRPAQRERLPAPQTDHRQQHVQRVEPRGLRLFEQPEPVFLAQRDDLPPGLTGFRDAQRLGDIARDLLGDDLFVERLVQDRAQRTHGRRAKGIRIRATRDPGHPPAGSTVTGT